MLRSLFTLMVTQVSPEVAAKAAEAAEDSWKHGGFQAVATVLLATNIMTGFALYKVVRALLAMSSKAIDMAGSNAITAERGANATREHTTAVTGLIQDFRTFIQEFRAYAASRQR